MDFNKIKINYGGKLTCRKIFKKKYIIFLIVSTIILIVLISLFTVKSKKIKSIQAEIKDYEQQRSKVESSYNFVKDKNQEDELNLHRFKNQINTIKQDVYNIRNQEEKIKLDNKDIINQRNELEKKSATLSTQLKTIYELKDVYEKKVSSLIILLESLKIEYNKLVEQKGGEKEDKSSIKLSKIVSPIEAFSIEKKIKGTIADKCFDGPESNYSPKIFHDNCDQSAILILIKTQDHKRIGGFIKVPTNGFEIKKDSDSVLINIDENKYFYVQSPEYTTIVCDPNELPHMGLDLQIRKDGKGISIFPFHYGKSTDSNKDFYNGVNFNIENLEIYKVKM